MTSYSRNQFFNFSEYESGTMARTANDNPEFLYPGNRIPNIYDSPGKPQTDTLVQRGFIRGIFPEVIASLSKVDKKYKMAAPPIRRCFFQFNPSLILRSVTNSTSTLNPLMQNPAELLQPIPGQSSFQFDLLFNREREVSNQEYLTASGIRERVTTLSESLDKYGSEPKYLQQHVGDLGVLVDLYVLDSIIGQSISADIVDTVIAYWDATKSARNTSSGTPTETDDGTVTTVTTDFDVERLRAGVGKVLGNSAFLNPLPVRIVFSSLFMVEGFVTSSQVAFHKFTKTMVPTVCQVTLNVQALYIGFAKKDSYLSQQIADQLRDANELDATTQENKNDAVNLLNTKLHLNLGYIRPSGNNYTNQQGISIISSTLNQWFAEKYNYPPSAPGADLYFESYYSDPDSTGLYRANDGLRIWIDDEFKNAVGGTLQAVSIEYLKLYFVDKKLLPKSIKNQTDFKKAVDNNKIVQMNRGARGESTFIIANVSIFNDKNKFNIPSKDIEGLQKGKEYKKSWKSSTFKPLPGRNINSYFGDEVAIVVETRIKADYKDAMGNAVSKGAAVTRSDVYWSFDPNSTSSFINLFKVGEKTSPINFTVTQSTVVAPGSTSTTKATPPNPDEKKRADQLVKKGANNAR